MAYFYRGCFGWNVGFVGIESGKTNRVIWFKPLVIKIIMPANPVAMLKNPNDYQRTQWHGE